MRAVSPARKGTGFGRACGRRLRGVGASRRGDRIVQAEDAPVIGDGIDRDLDADRTEALARGAHHDQRRHTTRRRLPDRGWEVGGDLLAVGTHDADQEAGVGDGSRLTVRIACLLGMTRDVLSAPSRALAMGSMVLSFPGPSGPSLDHQAGCGRPPSARPTRPPEVRRTPCRALIGGCILPREGPISVYGSAGGLHTADAGVVLPHDGSARDAA